MRSIIGLQIPAAGTVEVLGQEVHGLDSDQSADLTRQWGVLFQGGALFSTLTVGENVEVPLKQFYPDMTDTLRQEIARFKVRLSGLPEEAAFKYPSELSGGMRKRAGLARALALLGMMTLVIRTLTLAYWLVDLICRTSTPSWVLRRLDRVGQGGAGCMADSVGDGGGGGARACRWTSMTMRGYP
jgi:ABC-type uncharacterized transport system YnjBCD ATPase subunit